MPNTPNTKNIIFIKQNIFGRCVGLFFMLMSCFACLLMLFSVIDNLILEEFRVAVVFIFFFIIFLLFAYSSIINLNKKVGFAPDAIVLAHKKIKQTWNYDDIDWLSCAYGEVELPYNRFGRLLGRLFFKSIMDGVIICCRGKIFNLSLFSGSEFRKLAKIHLEPHKIITHIHAQQILSEKSRLAKINYKISYNPYFVLLAIVLALGVFLFVLIEK